jgi:hypothetical protein
VSDILMVAANIKPILKALAYKFKHYFIVSELLLTLALLDYGRYSNCDVVPVSCVPKRRHLAVMLYYPTTSQARAAEFVETRVGHILHAKIEANFRLL